MFVVCTEICEGEKACVADQAVNLSHSLPGTDTNTSPKHQTTVTTSPS
jgi:hypothetical protein